MSPPDERLSRRQASRRRAQMHRKWRPRRGGSMRWRRSCTNACGKRPRPAIRPRTSVPKRHEIAASRHRPSEAAFASVADELRNAEKDHSRIEKYSKSIRYTIVPLPCFAVLRRSTTPSNPDRRASSPVMSPMLICRMELHYDVPALHRVNAPDLDPWPVPDTNGARYTAFPDALPKSFCEHHEPKFDLPRSSDQSSSWDVRFEGKQT